MCMSRMDKLTPRMLVQKVEQERSHLQKMLTVDAQGSTKSLTQITRILNFVCLENLNKQFVRILREAIEAGATAADSRNTTRIQV